MAVAAKLIAAFRALAAGWLMAVAMLAASVLPAAAQDGAGQPRPDGIIDWQMDFQNPASVVMEYIHWFGWYTLIIMVLVVLMVVALLGWCALRFNERANPVPSRVTHNTLVEVLWTVLPVLVLVAIAIPSFKLLYGQYDPSKLYANYNPDTDKFLTLKVTGVQWAWNVDYVGDEDNTKYGVAAPISLYLLGVPQDKLAPGQPRNLTVDNPIIVPVGTFVRVQVTAEGDAIHSLALPAFGLKEDAVPGRLNETYFRAEREGMFYGQCSELCGKDHAFMPIAFHVVSMDQFRAWAGQAANDLPGAYNALTASIERGTENQKLAAR